MSNLKKLEINHLDICNLAKIPVKMQENPFRLLAISILNGLDDFNDVKKIFTDSYLKKKITKTLGILYEIQGSIIADLPANTIFFPWTHSKPVDYKKFNDVVLSIFSDETYLKSHYNRIKKLIDSIKKYGYTPDKFPTRQGGICGHFLTDGNNKKFFITAGNHRAAVLSALHPDKQIPITIERRSTFKSRDLENRGPILEEYSSKNINSWPAVKNKFLDKNVSLKIFNSYL